SFTRRPNTSLASSRATTVTTAHQTMVKPTLTTCTQTWWPMSKSASPVPPSDGAVNTPVRTAPTMPPTPWTPNTSAVSSTFSSFFRPVTPHTQIMPAARPTTIAPSGPTVPQAGVMPTRPATAPDAAPSAEGLPLLIASTTVQPTIAAEVARMVLMKARAAVPSAAAAEPALKP